MKITYYGYNAFLINSGNKKIAIDPGALFFYWFRFTTLIPKSEWRTITHIFVTHGDPDHYWHADRVAKVSSAPVICNKSMVRAINGKSLMLGPRDKGLAFTTEFLKLHLISVNETTAIDDMTITGIETKHGELMIKLGPFSKTFVPGPKERIGWGSIGFEITVDGKRIINLGDTLLLKKEWVNLLEPDVLMLPIGGQAIHNTMNVDEAVQAVELIKPKQVIPCHYNCPAFFSRSYNSADDQLFKREVEKNGIKCTILQHGSSITLD